MKIKRRTLIIAITSLFVCLLTAFIFSNSMQTGEESGAMSDIILELIKKPLSLIGLDISDEALGFFIRKAAHFSEYFVLGALISVDLLHIFKSRLSLAFAPIYPLVIAVCDEFIVQNATEGRSPELRDVLIDLSGAVIATISIYFILIYINRRKIKKGVD
jgi:VanZ family protein